MKQMVLTGFEQTDTKVEFHCKDAHYFEDKDNGIVLAMHTCSPTPMYFLRDDFQVIKAKKDVCPKCGQAIAQWLEMSACPNEDGTHFELRFIRTDLIRIIENDYKISVGVFASRHYTLKADYRFTKFYTHYVINTKTGYTYKLGKSTPQQKAASGKNRSLINISYIGPDDDLMCDAIKHLSTLIDKKIRMTHGFNTPSFESYNHPLMFDLLIHYVRNPYICPVQYRRIMFSRENSAIHETPPLKELCVKNTCRDPINQMLSQSKIPNVKSLRKIVFTDNINLPLLAYISRSFQNIDVIRSLFEAYKDCTYHGMFPEFSAKIFKTMIKHKGENFVARMLIAFKKNDKDNNVFHILRDTIMFYNKVQPCDFDFTKNYSLNELHIYLAEKAAYKENVTIEYEAWARKLEASNNTYTLSLAEDTNELIRVGAVMHICVGGYADKVINEKGCLIFILRDNTTRAPIGCIEYSDGFIIQAKGPNNRLLQNEEIFFVGEWIIEKELIIRTDDLLVESIPTDGLRLEF